MKILNNPEKLHEHFFVFPFRCSKCGNIFILEHGLRIKKTWYEPFNCLIGEKKYYKYCDICSRDIVKKEEEKNND